MPITYRPGEAPVYGVYECTGCRWRVHVNNAQPTLPPCDYCGWSTTYTLA